MKGSDPSGGVFAAVGAVAAADDRVVIARAAAQDVMAAAAR
jgi:hypothetical protein